MHVFEKYHNEILRKVTTQGEPEPDIRFAARPCLEMLESLCNIFSRCIMHRFFSNANKKLSYCRGSSRYGKIRDSGGSADRNRNPEYDLDKTLFY